ncbi:relaxase [Salinicola corii]|uniref:Relaxase n=1 Tax=Salinicola corii TaxID=2606937 RepID=A0A640W6X9_9GAMM|nr:MobH family relaxase [Salinicola corii]KAA0015283.1 relaxase [Salinicola corii]
MLRRIFPRASQKTEQSEGFTKPHTGKALLDTPRRQQMVKMLWDTTSLTHSVFDEYLLAPICRYAELVQLLPASESHHHAYAGGMLDHALEMACYGLRLRQQHLLPPGARPEDQSSAGELWSAAIVCGALMHDVAKVLVDVKVSLEDGREWHVWHGPIPVPYRVRYRKGREYHLHSAVNPVLCQQVLGANVMDWLMTQPKLFSLFMYTISGHTERGGIIAELIHQADRASVAKALGGDPVQALTAPVESIQRKLAEGLRYLVREQFTLNQKGGQAWLTGEALWLVSPRAIHELKAHLYAQGIKSIPADLDRLYGELQAHGIIEQVSEGKSVWKCEITDSDWQKTLNMIKVSPTLIWGTDERPDAFEGQVSPHGAGDSEPAPAGKKEPEQPESQPGGEETASTDPGPATLPSGQIERETSLPDDLDSALLELLPDTHKEQASGDESDSRLTIRNNDASKVSDINKVSETICEPGDPGNASDLGAMFWQWLQTGIEDHSIIINDTKAQVHVVDGTYFLVSPGIFKRYSAKVLGDGERWKSVQTRFQKLGHHIRDDNKNIHQVLVDGPNKQSRLQGYLIKKSALLTKRKPNNNRLLTLEENGTREVDNE